MLKYDKCNHIYSFAFALYHNTSNYFGNLNLSSYTLPNVGPRRLFIHWIGPKSVSNLGQSMLYIILTKI